MKTAWQGTLSFGLVNIPIGLYSAVQSQSLGFTLLCEKCHNPISYKRWCEHCRKEIPWNSIVKGLKLPDGTYFILTQENLHALKPHRTEALSIVEFVDPALIDVIYLETHYYVAPKKKGDASFFLFVEALRESKKVAIGTFVMRDKEHVCVIMPYQEALLATTLNYVYEIRDISEISTLHEVPSVKPQELALAQALMSKLTSSKFDMKQFKDHFADRFMTLVEQSKGKRKKKVTVKEKSTPSIHGKNLISTLRASLEQRKSKQPTAHAKKRGQIKKVAVKKR